MGQLKAKNFIIPALLAGGAMIGTVPTFADHKADYRTELSQYIDARDPEFRAAHPVRVFIGVDAGRRGRRGPGVDNPFEARIVESIARYLGPGIQLVRSPRDADLALRLQQQDFDVNFRVVDRDIEDKKYKKRDRYRGGQCGYARKAYYTEITEKGVAEYDFDLKVRVRGEGRYRDNLRGRTSEKYKYAENLRAATNCGLQPTNHIPSKKVARLLDRAQPYARKEVVRELRGKTAHAVAHRLSYVIKGHAQDHWSRIAERLNDRRGPDRIYEWSYSNVFDHPRDGFGSRRYSYRY